MSNNVDDPPGGNYTYYDAKIELPHVNSFSTSPNKKRQLQIEEIQKEAQQNIHFNTKVNDLNNLTTESCHRHRDYEKPIDTTTTTTSSSLLSINTNQRKKEDQERLQENNITKNYTKKLSFIDDDQNMESQCQLFQEQQDTNHSNAKLIDNNLETDDKPLFVPCPPSKPKPNGKIIRAQVHPKPRHELKDGANVDGRESELLFNQRLPPLESEKDSGQQQQKSNIKILTPCLNSTPHSKSSKNVNDSKSITRDKRLIDQYKELLNERFHKDYSSESGDNDENDDFSISVSSLSSSNEEQSDDNPLENQTLTQSKFEPLYSLPNKDKKKSKGLNNILIFNANSGDTYKRTGSLPDMRSIVDMSLKRVSHVTKNESEAESEPGAKIGYKFKPLPPIPGTSSNINNSGLYETIDGLSKLNREVDQTESKESGKRKTFKDIATILTLVPRLTTNSVRSRKNDHRLADISQYIPDKKLKVFVGTWNMKGTKFLPSALEDFLLPPESIYLQDVYVIGTQEGTPFRREWQVRLQETFGPSHVLMQASNFGVLQLSIFVRRELVWFCSNVEQDTIATRVGHKIKTKGALAMSFSIFGTSFLFLTSHFTSDKEKLSQRINDYRTICKNIQLPAGEGKFDEPDVTNRFDRVFWFGDFNFRIQKSRDTVDRIMGRFARNQPMIIRDLLQHDQLNEIFERGKIFHGFAESDIRFMPTYKFDVNTDTYDTSHKKRVPSWTDRIVFKTKQNSSIRCLHYNSCNTIKVSDHRAVYGIFETQIEPYQSNFTVPGANFDREIYVEANLRRNAPAGSQSNSHVCTIL